jgi:hypothetical protein
MSKLVPPASALESPAALLAWAKDNGLVELDVRFVDMCCC